MKTCRLLLTFACLFVLIAASGSGSAIDQLSELPTAKMPKAGEKWRNPSLLLIDDKGIYINGSSEPVPLDHFLEALAALPQAAWPYGRAVEISAFPGLSGSAYPDRMKIVDRVEAVLKSAHIAFILAASA